MNIPYPRPFWARLISFGLALVVSALVLFHPRLIAATAAELDHGVLVLMMWGVATGFVHGVGFEPRAALWRVAFHPLLGWALMLITPAGIVLTR